MLTRVVREIEKASGVKIVHSPPKKGISWSVSHNKLEFSTDSDKNPSADSAPAAFPGQVKLNIEHTSKTKSTALQLRGKNSPFTRKMGTGCVEGTIFHPLLWQAMLYFCP